jgi:hypothetical protein
MVVVFHELGKVRLPMLSVVMFPCVGKPGQDEKRPHAAGYALIGPDRVKDEEEAITKVEAFDCLPSSKVATKRIT